MPRSKIGAVIDQVLSGLQFMHENDLIHLDVKPDNILFTRCPGPDPEETRYNFVISDLGLTSTVRSARQAGTPCYQAPECHRDEAISTASDVYSFGIVLLQLLGLWCYEEGYTPISRWREKLGILGVKDARGYKSEIPGGARETQPTHSRIQSLVDNGIVCPTVGRLLDQDPHRRPSAAEARSELLAIFPRRVQPEEGLDETESPPPRLQRQDT